MRKITTEDFIARATAKHNGRYSYDLVDYKKSTEKVVLTCSVHGNFLMTPGNHLAGTGCVACKQEAMSKLFRKDNATFLAQARKAHGDKYDYAKTNYTVSGESVTITCRTHGDFKQLPNHHIGGRGCAECGKEKSALARTLSRADFIEKSRAVHGDTYRYDDVVYEKAGAKVSITCKEHGIFDMAAHSHLSGQGCKKCGHGTISQDEFITKAREVHGDRYDYSEVVYTGVLQKVNIICREHGAFAQLPYVHLRRSGCAACGVTGFNPKLSGTLYVLACGDMIKVGITNKTATCRSKRISGSFGREFIVLKEFSFEDGQECSDVETKLLRTLRARYESPTSKFDGYTETFLCVDLQWLYGQIETLGVEFA